MSPRTVRNDIERLRELGYPVEATRGPTGYYQLGVGAELPPLLLDDEEAVAVAIGLRAAGGVSGIGESSARALAKLEQVLPHRLRRQVSASEATSQAPDLTGTNVADQRTRPPWPRSPPPSGTGNGSVSTTSSAGRARRLPRR